MVLCRVLLLMFRRMFQILLDIQIKALLNRNEFRVTGRYSLGLKRHGWQIHLLKPSNELNSFILRK